MEVYLRTQARTQGQFATKIPHAFDKVRHQIERGGRFLQETSSFASRLAELQRKHALELSALAKEHTCRLAQWKEPDRMNSVWAAWLGILKETETLGSVFESFASELETAFLAPSERISEHIPRELKELVDSEAKHNEALASLRASVNKSRSKTKKVLDGVSDLGSLKGSSSKAGFLEKRVQKRKITTLKKAHEQASRFQEELDSANQYLQGFVTRDLPHLMSRMQKIEMDRCDVMKSNYKAYIDSWNKLSSRLSASFEKMLAFSEDVNIENDISNFTNHCAIAVGAPEKYAQFEYGLEHTVSELAGALKVVKNKGGASFLYASLEEIMKMQKSIDPDFPVPKIFAVLVKGVEVLGGLEAEGIFRLSASFSLVNKLVERFDSGDLTVPSGSPHTVAALLKKWMRDLPEPLFPNKFYNTCIQIAIDYNAESRDEAAVAAELDRLVSELPAINQRIIYELVHLVRKIIKNEPVNLMNAGNLAVVLNVSLLSNPDPDPTVVMRNSQFEVKFTELLFKYVPLNSESAIDSFSITISPETDDDSKLPKSITDNLDEPDVDPTDDIDEDEH